MTLGLLDRMEAGVAGSRNSSAFQLIRLTTKCALCKECHQLESSHSFNSLGLVPGKLLEAMIKAQLLLVTQPDQNKRTMKPQPKTPPECTCFCKQCTRWCFSSLNICIKRKHIRRKYFKTAHVQLNAVQHPATGCEVSHFSTNLRGCSLQRWRFLAHLSRLNAFWTRSGSCNTGLTFSYFFAGSELSPCVSGLLGGDSK